MRLPAKSAVAALVLILVLVVGTAVAFAVHTLAVSTNPAVITYPRASRVLVKLDGFASEPATITMQYRRIDGGAWTTWPGRTIRAKRSAEATSFHFTADAPWLNQTTEFRAVANGATSNVATITVKARLSKPGARVWRGGRSFASNITFTGYIWPRHEKGTEVVTLSFAKMVDGAWVPQPALTVKAPISRWRYWMPWGNHRSDFASRWAVPVPLATFASGSAKTLWRIQASHEDTAHALSQSQTTVFSVR